MTQFDDVKAALCGVWCISKLNCPWCILRKVTDKTKGDYRMKDLIEYNPKRGELRRYGKIH